MDERRRHEPPVPPIDPDMVRVFHAELDPRNSMADMRRAIRDFYATSEGKWMSAAAMNRLCKQYRASRLPDEATMCRLLEADGISDPEAELRYRRTLVHNLANNETPKQARERQPREQRNAKTGPRTSYHGSTR